MKTLHLQAAVALVPILLLLSGCVDTTSKLFDPNAEVKLTGKTVYLTMTVVDLYNSTLYPGLKANLWAFCAEPTDPTDAYSAAAIEGWTPLEGDWPELSESRRGHCSVPGPTIRVHQGDRVVVEFSHTHVHPHTIHWHGQYVPYEMDGVPGVTQEAVGGSTGQFSFTYDFIAKRPGTLWYHCHVDTQFHVMQGLYGMFIVIPTDQSTEPKDISHEYNLVFSTMHRSTVEAIPGVPVHGHPPGSCYISGSADCQNVPQDISADVFLINGHSYPLTMQQPETLLKIDEGERIRVRLLNAGNTVEEFHLHGHDMLVTHKDGIPLQAGAQYYGDTITVGPAERYDIVIEGSNPGVWVFHTHVNDHEANDGQGPGGMHGMMVYDGFEDKMHEYEAELAGGLPYAAPVPIPQDLFAHTEIKLANGIKVPDTPLGPAPAQPGAVSATWSFPIEMECAVVSAKLEAFLAGSQAAFIGSSLTVEIKDPDGVTLGTFDLGRDNSGNTVGAGKWNATQTQTDQSFLLPTGNYTVTVGGTAVDVTVNVDVQVDYYGSYDEMKLSHHLYKTPICGEYGDGVDGAPTKVPGAI